jgi:hypothetical protein
MGLGWTAWWSISTEAPFSASISATAENHGAAKCKRMPTYNDAYQPHGAQNIEQQAGIQLTDELKNQDCRSKALTLARKGNEGAPIRGEVVKPHLAFMLDSL